MTWKPRIVLTLLFIAAFGYVVIDSWAMPFQARLFPWTIGLIGLGLLLVQLYRDFAAAPAADKDKGPSGADMDFTAEETTIAARKVALELFGWIYGLVAGLWLLGFHLTIPLFVGLYLLRSRVNVFVAAAITVGMWLVTWLIFDLLLSLPFPRGALFELFQ
jgi:hypothetical protein